MWTRIGLFLVFGVVMGAVVGVNIFLAYRFRPLFRPASPEQTGLDRYRDAVTPIRTWLLLGVSVVIGLFAGASGMGQWRTYLLWRNAQSFGTKDAQFDKDIGFYVFHLPWQHYLVDFVMATTVIALIATAVVHYLYGGIRLQVSRDRLSGAAQVQISVLLGVFVLAKGVDYYLDRFDLVNESNRLFTGMNYTADNAVLPAKNILLGIALICAVLFFLNIWRRTWQLPVVGLALLAVSSVLLGMIWPAIVQQFQVKPSEADKEAPYIQDNIEATRAAYDLDDVEYSSYQATPTGDLGTDALTAQTSKVPVIDPKLVRQTFEELQQGRAYYSVANVLDVDRYTLDNQETPLVLGVRELDTNEVADADQNWSNLHTVYTHGDGVIAAYANRTPDTEEGNGIVWAEGIESGQSELGDYERRIYFGEKSPDYSVVGKSGDGASNVELSLPSDGGSEGEESDTTTTTYDGEGGVPIGGTFRQFMYAVKFGEPNFLLSGRVNGNSKVLYDREPVERVEKVAPWLTIDSDAYPAVVDGKVQWIVDGYTTTDRYPGSQRESFDAMIDDALQEDQGLQTLPTDEINYMRSAVKATVDAYDGTVTLYAWDESDPILKAWSSAFPDTVLPKSEIPEELMPHLRYPEDLFKVQRYQLAKYHVTEAGDFYQGNDRWEVPEDPNESSRFQPPYRLFIDEDSDPSTPSTWAMSSVFVPRDKGNLASFVSVELRRDVGRVRQDAGPRGHRGQRVRPRPDRQRDAPGRAGRRGADPPQRRRRDATDLRQPAHHAGRGRADIRAAGLRRARRHLGLPDPAVRAGLLRRQGRHRHQPDRGALQRTHPDRHGRGAGRTARGTEPAAERPEPAAGQQPRPAAHAQRTDRARLRPRPGRVRPGGAGPGHRRHPALPREARGGTRPDPGGDRSLRAGPGPGPGSRELRQRPPI